MADDDDLNELQGGNFDMARRDFRSADLSGMDLSGRDFTAAHFEKAIAANSNFTGAGFANVHTRGMSAPGAVFDDVTAESTVFFGMELQGASFRSAKLSRSHFTRTNFEGADLSGADFSHAVINEGCNFANATVDATTRFDGAAIFRPLARQEAFRFYRVDRGLLVRRDEAETAEVGASSPRTAGPIETPPRYTGRQGTIDVDYRRFDGRISLGRGAWEFETRWSNAGEGSVHVYRYPPSIAGVAVARDLHTIEAVGIADFLRADFTSTTRTPSAGEVVLLRNLNGFSAAIQIVAVTVGPESKSKTRLEARYRIFTEWGAELASVEPTSVYEELRTAADTALASLEVVSPLTAGESEIAGMGHNGPPPDAALSTEEYEAVKATLIELREAVESKPGPAFFENSKKKLIEWRQKIISWARVRLDQIQEGFFGQLGVTLADPQRLLAAWLVVSGNLTSVVGAVVRALGGG